MLEKLKFRARELKTEAYAAYLAARDPRTPWYAKVLILFVVVHTFSPIDLIPDFIPVLGYLDDLIITPGGLWLAIRLIPPEVMADAREEAKQAQAPKRGVRIVGTVIVVILWIIVFTWVFYKVFALVKSSTLVTQF